MSKNNKPAMSHVSTTHKPPVSNGSHTGARQWSHTGASREQRHGQLDNVVINPVTGQPHGQRPGLLCSYIESSADNTIYGSAPLRPTKRKL